MRKRIHWLLIAGVLLAVQLTVILLAFRNREEERKSVDSNKDSPAPDPRLKRRILGNDEPLIFIGGFPLSGLNLMRVLLDAHPDIRCYEETSIIPQMLAMRAELAKDGYSVRFNMNRISQTMLDDAFSALILETIRNHGPMAERLCDREQLSTLFLPILSRMFPNSKHILMIRDARATIHSFMERGGQIFGANQTTKEMLLDNWNHYVTQMVEECSKAKEICLKVYYERLVQRPSEELRRILQFLEVKWSDDVLNHHQKIGSKIYLNQIDVSSAKLREKVNVNSLARWFDRFPEEFLQNVDQAAPILRKLGLNAGWVDYVDDPSEWSSEATEVIQIQKGYNTSSFRPDYAEFAVDNFHQEEL